MNKLRQEQTLILAKPDAVQRGLVGEIINRFERAGFDLVGVKRTLATADHVKKHYLPTKEQLEGMGNKTIESLKAAGYDVKKFMGSENPMVIGKIINNWNVDLLTSGPVVAMVFEGFGAVAKGRKIVGATMPGAAELGTIRGDFSSDAPALANGEKRAVRNLVHASGSVDEAKREIKHWFLPKEIISAKK